MNSNDFSKIIEEISKNTNGSAKLLEELKSHLDMPNIPLKTMGGEIWWNNLVEVNGWKLQQNMMSKHCRILNSDDIRVAWGSQEAMFKALNTLTNSTLKVEHSQESTENFDDSVEKLKKLKELFDAGILTEEEYTKKKNTLISNL